MERCRNTLKYAKHIYLNYLTRIDIIDFKTERCRNTLKYAKHIYLKLFFINTKVKIFVSWRGARVVDRGGLENRCSFAGTQGSNPCLSEIYKRRKALFS